MNYMHCDSSAAFAYLEQDLGSDQTDLWVTFQIMFDSAALSLWQFVTGEKILQLLDAAHSETLDEIVIDSSGWDGSWGFGNVPPPTAGSWQTVEFHHVAGGTVELYVNSTLVYSATDGSSGAGVRFVDLGLVFGQIDPANLSDFTDVKIGTSRGSSDLFAWPPTSTDLSAWTTVSGDVTVVVPTPPVPTRARDLGHLWRFVVCDLDGTVLSLLDSLAEQRTVVYTLDAPAVATGKVPSDNPQVNLIVGSGSLAGDPVVSYSDRILFGFRREGGAPSSISAGPWKIRFSGLLMQIEDDAGSDDATSTYTAYDPWQYMLSRPVRDGDGNLPGPEGLTFDGGLTTLDQIAVNLISNTDVYDGHTYIDALDGHIETIPFVDQINIQQGTSVGDALTQLCNTGLMDIWLEPIYDPTVLPIFLTRLNIYAQQGAIRHDAVMSWDSPGKSLVGISRLLDGAQLANKTQFYNGQGGPPVTLQTNGGSALKYGEYWAQQFFPAQVKPQPVEDMASFQLGLRYLGKRTLTINPAPERAPDPFTSYFLGDLVPVYATKRLRQTLPAPQEETNYVRVYGIPIDISDNSVETVSQLLTSPDGFTP